MCMPCVVVLGSSTRRAAGERDVPVGRDDVDTVRLDGHPVDDLAHAHRGGRREQLDEDAPVVGAQVLQEDVRHAGVAGTACRSCLNASSPPAEAPTPTMGNGLRGREAEPAWSRGPAAGVRSPRLALMLVLAISAIVPRGVQEPLRRDGTFSTAAETVGRQGYPGHEAPARMTAQRPPNTSIVADDAGRLTVAEPPEGEPERGHDPDTLPHQLPPRGSLRRPQHGRQ